MTVRLICIALWLALVVVALVALPAKPKPLLIEPSPAAYVDQCGRIRPDLLDRRPGDPPTLRPQRQRSNA